MLSLTAELLVDYTQIAGVTDARIESDRFAAGDTATITLSKKNRRPSDFKKGQEVDLKLGYTRFGLKGEFMGVIDEVSPTVPITLKCFDMFHLLRQQTINRSFWRKTIEEILTQVMPAGIMIVAPDTPRISMACPGRTLRWFIMKLADIYGYNAFFRDGRFYFVKPDFQETIIELPVYKEGVNIIEDNLYFHEPEGVTSVIVISESEYGYLVQARYGASRTNTRTVHAEGLDYRSAYSRAKELYQEYNFKGFRGHFTTFGYPYIRHSWPARIISNTSGKSGTYLVDKVETSFGTGGFRRTIHLGALFNGENKSFRNYVTLRVGNDYTNDASRFDI